jgi:hypothetical protein
MKPIRFRIPSQGQGYLEANQPRPSELPAWLEAQSSASLQTLTPELLSLLQKYNRRVMPAPARFKALTQFQPVTDAVLKYLREKYQTESLPLRPRAREHANTCLQLLDELGFGYKIVVAELVGEIKEGKKIDLDLLTIALKHSIDYLGQLLLESYSQYITLPAGLWEELHQLYYVAEQNKLHKKELTGEDQQPGTLATIQLAYLRLVLLALSQPYHLMPGQINRIYGYLEKWSAGCRMLERKVTVAETGDIYLDLASEQSPTIASSYTRFQPIEGRFLDITPLKNKLDEAIKKLDEKHQQSLHGGTFSIAERLQHSLLIRLSKAWGGRADRETERHHDGEKEINLCAGLDAAHHFISEGREFNPEREELHIHRPPKESGLSLVELHERPWDLDGPLHSTKDGRDQTRLSRFGEEVDVWDSTQQEHAIHVKEKREAKLSNFQMGPWLRMNQSKGGMLLRRLPESPSRVRVGSLVAYLDHTATKIWKLGIIRWLQDGREKDFDIGVMTIAHLGIPVAVRAIAGAGAGGEYFRSLLVQSVLSEGNTPGILVPASIYDIGTQLVINLQTELKYVRLMEMVETTSSFSLFEYKEIGIPPAEQARINAIGQDNHS